MSRLHYDHIRNNAQFEKLIRQRSRLSWTLASLVMIVYYSFILVIAFAPGMLGIPVSPEATMTWGILIGLGVILFTFLTTGIYVHKANTVYDQQLREVIAASEKHAGELDQKGAK